MTDEEKKSIEMLDKYITEHKLFNIKQADNLEDNIRIILNLIEKQSKEIEELKEKKGYHLGFIDGGIAKRYEYEDKIKAKIEPKLKELDEQINEEWKKYGNSKELQDMEDMYNFLQSLLEKE